MYSYTGTTCPKCGQLQTVPSIWMAVTPPPISCGCPKETIVKNTTRI